MTTFSIHIGTKVRVLQKDKESSCVGTISYIHESNPPSYDIIYDSGKVGEEEIEEVEVTPDRISPLQEFEIQLQQMQANGSNNSSLLLIKGSEWKDKGNSIFALKDYKSSSKYYGYALNSLHFESYSFGKSLSASDASAISSTTFLTIGADVLVLDEAYLSLEFDQTNPWAIYPLAMISDFTSTSSSFRYEVELSRGGSREGLKPNDLLYISSISLPHLFLCERSLYSNLAKCSLKKNMKGWAVRYACITASLSIHLYDYLQSCSEEEILKRYEDYFFSTSPSSCPNNPKQNMIQNLQKLVKDSLYLRGQSFLSCNLVKKAKRDGELLLRLQDSRGNELIKKASGIKEKILRINKKMVRDIVKWVDEAMNQM